MSFLKKIIKKSKDGSLKELAKELKWLHVYGLKYKSQILLFIIIGIFGIFMGYGSSILSKFIIDTVISKNTKYIALISSLLIFMAALKLSSNAFIKRLTAKTNLKVNMEIRYEIYKKILATDSESMSEFHSGDLLNRIDNDINSISGSVLGWWPSLVTGAVQFLGAFTIILYYDPVLALISLVSSPAAILLSKALTVKMRNYIKKTLDLSSNVMSFNEETFNSLQTIKALNLTNEYTNKLKKLQDDYTDNSLKYNKFSIITSTFFSVSATFVSAICFAWSVYRLWSGSISYGTMILFLQMAAYLSSSLSKLVGIIPSAISCAASAGRIMTISNLPKEDRSDDKKVLDFIKANKSSKLSLEFYSVSFNYKNAPDILTNASFAVNSGEIVALIGSSGIGKTTILKLLLGLLSPTRGEIKIKSKNGDSIGISPSTRALFSYVPQNNKMFSGTILDNLKIVNKNASDEDITNALKLSEAYEFVSRLPENINTPILENGTGFSEGQLQRLSIARSIISDNPILLLDEATSAIDTKTAKKILKNISEFCSNKICIITTHRKSVLEICNKIYKIDTNTVTKLDKNNIKEMEQL